MKAMLWNQGHGLYKEIWSDQPPVFTYVLGMIFRCFGDSIVIARIACLSFALLLMLTACDIIRRLSGTIAAVGFIVLLASSNYFLELCCSIMIGLPSIGIGVAAMWLVIVARSFDYFQVRCWLVIGAGILMGIAMQTKFSAAILLAPLLLCSIASGQDIGLVVSKANKSWERGSGVIALGMFETITLCTVTVITVAALWFASTETAKQVVAPHVQARLLTPPVGKGLSFGLLANEAVAGSPLMLPLALVGVTLSLLSKRASSALPAVWLLTAIASLAMHRPLHYHYVPLLSIPICWLAATGIGEIAIALRLVLYFTTSFRVLGKTIIVLIVSLVSLPISATIIRPVVKRYYGPIRLASMKVGDDSQIISQLEQYRNRSNWIFSDMLIYPFCVDLPVPPPLAVFTKKRLGANLLSDEFVSSSLEKYRPEQILIGRFNYGEGVQGLIRRDYVLVWEGVAEGRHAYHYVRSDIRAPIGPGPQ